MGGQAVVPLVHTTVFKERPYFQAQSHSKVRGLGLQCMNLFFFNFYLFIYLFLAAFGSSLLHAGFL